MNRATKDIVNVRLPATALFSTTVIIGTACLAVIFKVCSSSQIVPFNLLIAMASVPVAMVLGGLSWIYVIWEPVIRRSRLHSEFNGQIPVMGISNRFPLWVTGLMLFALFSVVGFFWVAQ